MRRKFLQFPVRCRAFRLVFWIALAFFHFSGFSFAQSSVAGSVAASVSPALYQPKPLYNDVACSSRYLTMRDGVKIAVDVCLPKGLKHGEKVPTILRQTRYWRSIGLRPFARALIDDFQAQGRIGELKKLFILHGYAWLDVDVRGSGASFGNRPYEWTSAEIKDGAEIVDWIISSRGQTGRLAQPAFLTTGRRRNSCR